MPTTLEQINSSGSKLSLLTALHFFLPTNTISSIKATVFLIEPWELYLSFYDSLASATGHTQRKDFLEQYDYWERGWEYAHS